MPDRDRHYAYALLRLLTGIDFFGHGFARIATGSHLSGFAAGMATSMAATPLPHALLLVTGYTIPVAELLIGMALILGLTVRPAIIAALLLMCVLMFASRSSRIGMSRASSFFTGSYSPLSLPSAKRTTPRGQPSSRSAFAQSPNSKRLHDQHSHPSDP